MVRLGLLLFLLCAHISVPAQKDSTINKNKKVIKTNYQESKKLTKSQQRWLNANYKQVAGLKKDSASTVIRKNFTAISESSIEYLISLAAKLQRGDNQQQLALFAQQLELLKRQKQALLLHLQQQEDKLAKETDPVKRNTIETRITDLKTNIREAEDNIRSKEEAIRELEGSS